MNTLYKYILCLLTALSITAGGAAQQKVKLSGRVMDEEQSPIIFATVKIKEQAAVATTDIDGKYAIEFNSADSVTVIFSMVGFERRERVLRNPSGDLRLTVTLRSESFSLGEVTVKETRRQMGTTQNINAENLKRLPSTTGNAVEELVATQAGVSTHNELSSQYNVRGGSFDENSVYINGVEVYRPMLVSSGQQEGLSIINSDMVENINFSAGGFEAKYGDKMASVLDITYKKPKAFEASAAASLLGGSLYAGIAGKRFSMTHGLRYKTNQYMLGTLETRGEYRPRFLDYQTYISWSPAAKWTVDLIGYVSQNKYDFIPADRQTNFGTMEDVKSFRVYFDGREKDLFRTVFGTLSLSYLLNANTRLSLTGSAFMSTERETYDIQGQYWLDETNTSEQLGVGTYMEHARNYLDANMKSLKAVFSHKTAGHNIESGITWKHEIIEETSREWEMRDSSGYSIPHTGDRLDLIYNLHSSNRISNHRMELYAQDTWRFENRTGIFTLNYGARLSYWTWNDEWLFSPRASIGYIPAGNEAFTLRAATGIYYQAPFYKELRDTVTSNGSTKVVLNRDIRAPRSIQFVVGGDYSFKLMNRPFKFTTEVYYKALSRLIPYNVDNMKIVYYGGNIASGYTTGIDFKIFGEFVEGTDSWLSFSLMKASQRVNGKSFPQATDQRYNLNFFFSDLFPGTTRWKMTLKACLADGLPFGPPHTGLEKQVFRAPAYKRIDIGMSYRLFDNEDGRNTHRLWGHLRNVWLGVECFNLFDISNVSSYYWVTDVTNQQYAVPNYLTGRLINARILIEL